VPELKNQQIKDGLVIILSHLMHAVNMEIDGVDSDTNHLVQERVDVNVIAVASDVFTDARDH
jgi:hypothetical protein